MSYDVLCADLSLSSVHVVSTNVERIGLNQASTRVGMESVITGIGVYKAIESMGARTKVDSL